MTQIMEMRKVVAAYSIHAIMESSELNQHCFSNSEKRQMEKRVKLHSFSSSEKASGAIALPLELSSNPSLTSEVQRSIKTSIMFKLSQASRAQKARLLSYILTLIYFFVIFGLFLMIQREAYISMRKKIPAISERVQKQQMGRVQKQKIMRAIEKRMLSRMARGPILRMVVSIIMIRKSKNVILIHFEAFRQHRGNRSSCIGVWVSLGRGNAMWDMNSSKKQNGVQLMR